MKRLGQSLITLALVIVAMGLISQTQDSGLNAKSTNKLITIATTDEYVFMKADEMLWHYDGKDMVLAGNYPCSDGTKVSVTGLVTKPDSSNVQLKNGDKVLSTGTIVLAQAEIGNN